MSTGTGRPPPAPAPASDLWPTEKGHIWFRASFAVNRSGRTVAVLRGGRFLWWFLIGWLVADSYRVLASGGTLTVVCIAALGATLGLLGSLTALIALIPMAIAGVPFSDQWWWTVPLLIGWVAGVAPQSLPRWRTAEIGGLAVLGVPVAAWFAGSRSWLAAVLCLWFLIRPYLSTFQGWLVGLTRVNRVQVLWGAVLWILAATLLAMGPAGGWFVGVWPRTPLGWLLGTLCVGAAFAVLKGVLLMAVRASLSDVRTLGAWSGLRLNRDCFSGVYGATFGLPWFCFLAAGVFHDRWDVEIGCAAVFFVYSLPAVMRRLDRPVQEAIDRLDAALYLFSAPARRAELTADWLDDFRRTIEPIRTPQYRARSFEAQRFLRLRAAFALVHVMCDESRKTAFGDVDDTLWLPFRRIGVRPQLLSAALTWVDEAIGLLDAANVPAGDPAGSSHAAELARCRHFRSLANFLYGRPEEGILDAAEAARISHEAGAYNTEIIMWNNAASTFADVPVRHGDGQIARVRTDAAGALARAAGDDRVHPQIRRQIAVAAAYVSMHAGSLPQAEALLRLAAGIPLPQPEQVTMGVERIVVSERGTTVAWGFTSNTHQFNLVDYTHFLDGTAPIEEFLVYAANPYAGRYIRAVLTADAHVPGLRRLQKTVTMKQGLGTVPGDMVTIRDNRVVERWVDTTERRGGWEIAADFREMLGYFLRELDPYRAAEHLARALDYRQHVQFGLLDEDLRIAVRGAAEVLSEIVIDHVAGLALHPIVDPGPPLGEPTLQLVVSVKSRSFLELMGDRVPPPPDDHVAAAEREAQQRYDEARATTDHARLREAREDLEQCWSELIAAGGQGAEYAALRAGLPMSYPELRKLLTDLAT